MIHPCDGQRDGETDGWATAYMRYSTYAVACKKCVKQPRIFSTRKKHRDGLTSHPVWP